MTPSTLTHLSNADLLLEVKRLAARERQASADLIAALMEIDVRRLYLGEGCSSLFTYCTQVLHLSEHAAYGRIEAARVARRFPVILDLLAEGFVTLTTVGLLAPHLTPENHRDLLESAWHKSKRDVEHLVAELRPQSPVQPSVRKLPAPHTTQPPPPTDKRDVTQPAVQPTAVSDSLVRPDKQAIVKPLAPERYKIQCTIGRDTYEKLRRAQDLLRHTIPNGDVAAIFDRALTLLLGRLERAKLATTDRPRIANASTRGSRHVPAAVRRAVWQRDGGRCAFVGTNGHCTETGFLEFHHVVPYAAGGATTADNLELRCRAHNGYEAERYFGPPARCLVREEASVPYL